VDLSRARLARDSDTAGTRAAPAPADQAGYLRLSTRPLHVLAFLFPLVIAYEAGSAFYLSDPVSGVTETIRAHSMLLAFFQNFGVAARAMPALLLVGVLVVWHILLRDRWRLHPPVLLGMVAEAAVLTLPVLVLAILVQNAGIAPPPAVAADFGLLDLPWQTRLTISIGAGVYEEMLFRLIFIAAAHLVLVDVLSIADKAGRIAAVVASAAAFAVYHDLGDSSGGAVDLVAAAHYFLAGLYFGVLYLARGLGIAAGVHALYDIAVLIAFPAVAGR
jgi:hypothetical protein